MALVREEGVRDLSRWDDPLGEGDDRNPAGWRGVLWWGYGIVFLFFGVLGVWAALAPLESGAVAQGQVQVAGSQRVIQHLDELGESARLINAVNCVVAREGRLVGENTDGKGFLSSLRPVLDPAGRHGVVLGAGGAARAIAVELALAGVGRLTIVNRTPARAAELASLVRAARPIEVEALNWDADYAVPATADVLVNATSIGLGDATARVPVAAASLRPGLVVADVIPNPPQTALLIAAAHAGCTTLDGLGMLVGQGVLGINYWTGVGVDPVPMRTALEEVFS